MESKAEAEMYDAARVGSAVIDAGRLDEDMCKQSGRSGGVPYGCTREIGHAGQHVAEGTSQVWAVWA